MRKSRLARRIGSSTDLLLLNPSLLRGGVVIAIITIITIASGWWFLMAHNTLHTHAVLAAYKMHVHPRHIHAVCVC